MCASAGGLPGGDELLNYAPRGEIEEAAAVGEEEGSFGAEPQGDTAKSGRPPISRVAGPVES